MADNLIFPIGFDLEAGVKQAEKNADMALRRLQTALDRKPLSVPITMDASKFSMFERQFSNSINGIQAKLAQAQRLWNSMTFDTKFDENGNLSRRAQIVFDAFNQLTQASATMGQRLGEVNRQLVQSEAETARLITAEYDKRKRQIDEQIRLKERQAAAEERVRQSQLKGVNVGYVDLQKQTEAVRNLRLQYEAILPMLNALAQKRVDIKVSIDKQFEADVNRINAEIARLRQSNLQLGARGDGNAIQANLAAIRQLESELQRISQQKIDLLNTNKINSDISRLRTEIASVFGELQTAERKLAADNSLNAALDAQSQKVLKLHADIQKLDQQVAQLNAQGKMYNADGSFSTQATALLQQRIALTKQLEQAAVTGQQAQIKLEQQLREEKRRTDQEAKQAAKEAERQAKAEAAARKQAIEAANAENKARQAAYNAQRKQGLETQRILQKEAKSIADITAQLQIQQQRLNNANVGSAKFNKIAEEVKRLTAELDKANKKMRELTGQTTSGAERQAAAVRNVSKEYHRQDGYVSRLIKRLAVYAGFQQISNFITSVREVTAQFELQRISLGAIIQDQTRANALFSEIKQFALKSPISIMDLTKYTKQVAAYKIETDKLFDTTKRLADVSVGLGVDMGRLVLAYGQVKAASYLRAAEIRQFTEAGIPMLELLAEKFTALNGEAVTTEQVMEMVSKRMVSFSMVEDIFNDMTSAGGMFYNMQEKQGNTLFGLWAKLGDAASMMYDEIGNTESVNSGIKASIDALTDLMHNWKAVAKTAAWVVAPAALTAFAQKKGASVYDTRVTKAIEQRKIAQDRLNAATTSGTAADKAAAQAALNKAMADEKAAIKAQKRVNSMSLLGRTTRQLGAGLLSIGKSLLTGLGIGLVITAVTTLAYKLFEAFENANRLKNELAKIKSEGAAEMTTAVNNFNSLANAAVNAADGSKEQRDALDELKRTYGNVIPEQELTIAKLREMKGEYSALTTAIKENIAQQKLQESINAIKVDYGDDIKDARNDFKNYLTEFNDGETFGDRQAERIVQNFEKYIEQGLPRIQALSKALSLEGEQYANLAAGMLEKATGPARELYTLLEGMQKRIRGVANEYANLTGELGKYSTQWEIMERMNDAIVITAPEGSYEASEQVTKQKLGNLFNYFLKPVMGNDIWKQFQDQARDNGRNLSNAFWESLAEAAESPAQKSAVATAKAAYYQLIPSNETVRIFRDKANQIATEIGVSKEIVRKYYINDNEGLKDYRKRLKDEYDKIIDSIIEYETNKRVLIAAGKSTANQDELLEKAKNDRKILEALIAALPTFPTSSSGGRAASDNRLSQLREIEQTLTTINSKYEELLKKEGRTKALADIQKIYGDTLAYINKLGDRFGLDFAMPTEFKTLQDYRKAIRGVIETLKMTGHEKAALELQTKIDTGDVDKLGKEVEEKIKQLADEVSRTKTAKEFYDKVLGMTGNYNLAAKISMSIYGGTGFDLQKQLVAQIRQYFKNDNVNIEIPVDIITSDNQINYKKLGEFAEKYKEKLGEEPYKAVKKLAEQGQKDLAKTYEGYLKDLEKAKTYSDKRIELAQTTADKIRQIRADMASGNTEKSVGEGLISGLLDKEMREAAKLEWEAFKDTPLYVQMFDDLEYASKTTLEMMRSRIEALGRTWGSALDPTQLKEMQSRMNEITDQLHERNPWKALRDAYRAYKDATDSVSLDGAIRNAGAANTDFYNASATYGPDSIQAKAAEQELKAREKIVGIVKEITKEQGKQVKGQKALTLAQQKAFDMEMRARGKLELAVADLKAAEDKAVAEGKDPAKDPGVVAARERVASAKEEVELTTKVSEILTNNMQSVMDWREGLAKAGQMVEQSLKTMSDIAAGIAKATEALGGDEEDVQYWNDISTALNEVSGGIGKLIQDILKVDIGAIISDVIMLIPNMISGFAGLFSAGKIRKANKEIRKQQEILENLEYTYGRLQKAAEKLFGAEYISNYNQQLKNLYAQAEAQRKQAEAERSKGKKKDKDKVKEYENAYRDTMDEIADMQGQLVEKMTGTDVASAARDFANAWIDAYIAFGDTTEAIKGKFRDMIRNMIVESVMAKTVELALTPMFEKAEEMYRNGASTAEVAAYMFSQADAKATEINDALMVNAHSMEALGMDLRSLGEGESNLRGIKREIGSASEETMGSVAVIGNTLMYYVSPIPKISENVAAMRALMEGGSSASVPTAAVGWTDWQQQAMDHYAAIQRNTADTVTECRNIAAYCKTMAEDIHRVVKPKNTSGSHGVQVYM